MNVSFFRPGKDNGFWRQRESQRNAEEKDILIRLSSHAHSQGPSTNPANALTFTCENWQSFHIQPQVQLRW